MLSLEPSTLLLQRHREALISFWYQSNLIDNTPPLLLPYLAQNQLSGLLPASLCHNCIFGSSALMTAIPNLSSPSKISPLARATASTEPISSICAAPAFVIKSNSWLCQISQVRNFTGVIHAHLYYCIFMLSYIIAATFSEHQYHY